MTYRRTAKYSAERQRAMRGASDRPLDLPDVRMRITVERMDPGAESTHVFELRKSSRVDQYAVWVDGKPWRVVGMAGVLEGIRKATPRMLSGRAL